MSTTTRMRELSVRPLLCSEASVGIRGGLYFSHALDAQKEQLTIRHTVQAVAGMGSRVRLFGSRVDDLARAGDIDLLVEFDHAVAQLTIFIARVGARLQQALGDRRIDVLLVAPNLREEPVHRAARETGIEL